MSTLYFRVSSDWQEVVRLREEINKLESQLKSFGKSTPEQQIRQTEERLASTRQEFMKLTTEAAKAGAAMENDFKKKIYDASQTVNGLTEKIIAQKNVVKKVEADVKRLGDAYRTALKNNPISASYKLDEYNYARRALDEERAALFGLTQQQAEARLSVKKLRDEYSLYKREGEEAVDVTKQIEQAMTNMGKKFLGGYGIKEFISQMVRVRGEFQSMQTAIETMVGKDMAGELIPQIKELAKISPLTLTDMVNAEKMMLGFNIQAEDTIRYLQALSDISMGNSVKFNSLTLAFSQMSAAGKLMGQDLNQMINAGFNPLQIIAEKTGKSIATLKNEMSKGAISAEMVQQAFIDATSAGGKFYQMSENASKTINGQLSMMQDALDNAFNEIGTASEGVIMKGIEVTTSLIENYETIGKVLIGLIATYGTYRGILIATTALEQVKNGTLLTTIKNTKLATAAQAAFNKVVKAHPYALIASLAIGAATAIFAFSERTTKASKASAQLSANIKNETFGLDSLFKKLKSAKEGTDDRKKAIEQINSKYGSYLDNLLTEKSSVEDIADAYEKAKKSIIDYNIEKSKNEYLQEPLSGLNKSTQEFYESISNFSKELSNDEQKGRFKAYIDQLVDSIRNGGYFDINQIYNAFRAAQSIQFYKSVDEWKEAFRAGKENFGMSDTDIINAVGGFDISNVTGAGKQLEAFSKSFEKAKIEFDSFSKSYREVSSIANKEELPISNISQEIENVTSKIKSLKQEISDLRSGKIQVEAGKTIESAISTKEKELQAAQRSLETLTGEKQKDKERISSQQKLSDELLSVRQKNQQDEINLMEEGSEKKIAQINLDYQKERDAIKKQAEHWAKEQGGTLTIEQFVQINKSYSYAKIKREKGISGVNKEEMDAEIQAMNDYLKEYGTYQEKRLAITQEYSQKINEAGGAGTWSGKTLQKQMEEALADLDIEAAKTTSSISQLFGDMTDKTLAELERINEEGSAALEFLKSGEWDESKGVSFGITQEQFNTISKSPEMLQAISEALRDNKKSADELRPAYQKIADGLRDIFKAGQDGKQLNEALSDIQDGLNQVMQTTEFLSDTFSNLGDAFGSDTLSGIADGLNVAMDAVNSAMQGTQAGSLFGPIGAAAGAAIGVVSSLASSIAKIHDAKNEKQIQRLQDQIDTLSSTYDKLGREIENAYSKDASNLIEDQNKLLEQQKVLIEQQIAEEKDKKKSDSDRIKEWKEQLEEIDQTIEDNKEKAVDVIFGEDIQSAIENFSSAYAEAWANGEDRAESAKDTVKKMMQEMVTESIKAAVESSEGMEKIRKKLDEFYADNVLSDWEQDYIYKMAEDLQKELDRKFGWADSLFKEEPEEEETTQQQGQATSRGFGSEMTHEDAGELSGRFTSMVESNYRIEGAITEMKGSLTSIVAEAAKTNNIADETRSILARSFLELQQIRENTGEIVKPIKQMQLDIAEVKQNTSRL